MKKSELRGLGKVYRYTVAQTIKTKSFIAVTIIMILFAGLVFPVMNFINRDKSSGDSKIESETNSGDAETFKVYVNNTSGIASIDYKAFGQSKEKYAEVEFEETAKASEDILKEDSKAIYLEIKLELDKGMYNIVATHDEISESKTKAFTKAFSSWFTDYKKSVLALSEEKLIALETNYNVDDISLSKFISDKKVDILSSSEYNIVYAIVMVIYFLVVFSASSIATKVVEEKANRVVEYLLTTVRPMALIMGKVMATLTIVIAQITVVAVAAVGSNKISANLFGLGGEKSALSMLISFEAMQKLGIITLIVFIVVVGAGMLIYGMLAGLCGATVSKMEDIQQGLRTYNVIIVVFFIVDIIACELMWTVGLNAFTTFSLIFPLTSPFILPGALIVGRVSTVVLLIAIVLLILTALLIVWFVSRVYEAVIVMNGDPVTLKKVIKIARDRRKQA